MSAKTKRGIRVCVDVDPDADAGIFRSETADEILRLLVDANDSEFTISELADATGVARSTVWRAVDLLDEIGVLHVRETPQRKYVAIDPKRLEMDDPILAIPQSEFRPPVRRLVDDVRSALDEADAIERLVGIVLFGSVARGEADRRSDIDLFVVVEGDRTAARQTVADVVSDLRDVRFDGDRYDFEPYVESVASARRAGAKLRDIFEEGITLYEDDGLQAIRVGAFDDE